MQNSDKLQQGKQTDLIKWQNSSDNKQYIVFNLTPSNMLLNKIHKSKPNNKQKKYPQLFRQIEGGYIQYKRPLLQSQQMRNELLSNNIVEYGGVILYGQGLNSIIQQRNHFRLKLSHIQKISFKNLQILDFFQCNLESIDALSWLDIKNLNKLNLKDNHIISLKSFGKASFLYLQQLNLAQNKLSYSSTKHLSRFHSFKMQIIDLKNLPLFAFPIKTQINNTHQPDLKILVKTEIYPRKSFIRNHTLSVFIDRLFQTQAQKQWVTKINQHSLLNFKRY